MMNFIKIDEFNDLQNLYTSGKVSYAKMVELLNDQVETYANEKAAKMFDTISRLEVINHVVESNRSFGRVYTQYLKPESKVEFQLQDDNRTLKIFLSDKK